MLLAGAALAEPDAGRPANEAAAGKPDVATLLFSGSQWKNAPAGATLTYDYAKKAPDASFGPSFNDHVILSLSSSDEPGTRSVGVRMFSGENAKPAGPFNAVEQNPVLLLVLEESVQEMSASFKANPRYLKNAIRKAWRDSPSIAPVQVAVGGRTVDATRITVQPFRGDAEADRMKGLASIVYTVDVSEAVPGYVVAMDIHAPAEGAASFSEQLHYQAIKQP